MSNKTQQSMPWPEEDFSRYGEVEEKKLGNVQQYVGKAMHRNWTSIPHVTHNDDADITDFEQRRKAYNAEHPDKKKTLLPVLMKASVAMLQEFPQFNVSLSADGATMFQKHYYHIGFAVDVPGGLLVPVVKDCDKKSVDDIAEEIVALSEKARGKGLPMADMSGGCFTLSSLGHIGGTSFSPMKWKLENRLSMINGAKSPNANSSLICITAMSPSVKVSSCTRVLRVRKYFTASSSASPRVALLMAA